MTTRPYYPAHELTSDQALVSRALGEDKNAFAILIQRYRSELYYFVIRQLRNPEDAYDVVQETFISVWESLARYDHSRSFDVWIRRIALNKCRDKQRKSFVRRFVMAFTDSDSEIIESVPDTTPTPDEALSTLAAQQRFDKALGCLPDKLREPLILTYWEGFSQREAGEILGISAKAIENRISRAKKQLATALDSSQIE